MVAACDPLPERRAWAEREQGVPRTFSSVGELLALDGWDVAVVCTPSEVREPAVDQLAAAGKHILTEKPLADTYAEAARIVARCEEAGVRLAVNQNFRDHYAFGLAARLIADGEIGTVRGVSQLDLAFRQDRGWRIKQPRHARRLNVVTPILRDGARHRGITSTDCAPSECKKRGVAAWSNFASSDF